MKSRTFVGVALLLAALSLGACSQYRAMKGPYENAQINTAFVDYMVDKADSRLDLTPAQSDLYRTVIENLLAKGLAERPRNRQLTRDMAAAMRQERLDAEQLEGFLERKSEIMRAIMSSGIDDFIAFHDSLNAQQRNKLADLLLEMGDKAWQGQHW